MMQTADTIESSDHPHSANAKWAAIVDDKLVPLARQKLRAREILHQTGVTPGRVLVRDFNSPEDISFDHDAIVDLAEGNVFVTAEGRFHNSSQAQQGPPKLAFIVNDVWEVTIQPEQTAKTLRDLFELPKGTSLVRDYESPKDEPVQEGDKILFKDGPVFLATRRAPNSVTIIVAGTPHEWDKPKIKYADVATLFDPSFPQHPDTTYSITYDHGAGGAEGILSQGGSVKVADKMEFHVSTTGQS